MEKSPKSENLSCQHDDNNENNDRSYDTSDCHDFFHAWIHVIVIIFVFIFVIFVFVIIFIIIVIIIVLIFEYFQKKNHNYCCKNKNKCKQDNRQPVKKRCFLFYGCCLRCRHKTAVFYIPFNRTVKQIPLRRFTVFGSINNVKITFCPRSYLIIAKLNCSLGKTFGNILKCGFGFNKHKIRCAGRICLRCRFNRHLF